MASVIMYTTPTCGFCHMAKQYLGSRKVEFEEKDVTSDADAYNEILEKSDQLGVPVIDIDGSIVVGFDRNKIDVLLRDKKLV